ncbi:related to deoxyribonuclease [Rhynchosporium secalis]|uniref:Related to deoxyribonuclease n=1 Tax=Rhynchosporium secalis TaxID=38038 RepID=A0A1E1M6X3_RHYSE|nr:related to deoxyribonuclease [Rhynchosporium secalis]
MATAEPPSTIIIPNNTEIGNGNTADAIDKQTSVQPQKLEWKPRFVDIGINLTDPVYNGIYFDKPRHEDDLSAVVQRAIDIGCEKLIVTGSDLEHSETAVKLAEKYPNTCYATIGIHPCNAQSLTPETLISLKTLAEKSIEDNIAVAFGEIGLDYDRLELCPKETQLTAFSQQLSLAVDLQLPLFLHSRAAHADFLSLLSEHEDRLPKRGVVHSFTGSLEEMRELVARGWHISVNGCSMKTEENCAVVKEIPLDRLHLETDGPWCEIRPSHTSSAILGKMREDLGFAPKLSGKGKGKGGKSGEEEEDTSMGWGGWKSVKKEKWVEGVVVKGRNESCFIGRVAWAVAGIKGVSVKDVAEAAWRNSVHMFGVGVDLEEEAGAWKTDGLENGAES